MVCLLGVRVKYLGGEQVASCVYAPSKVSSVRCYATTWAWRGWTMVYSVMRSSPYTTMRINSKLRILSYIHIKSMCRIGATDMYVHVDIPSASGSAHPATHCTHILC